MEDWVSLLAPPDTELDPEIQHVPPKLKMVQDLQIPQYQ